MSLFIALPTHDFTRSNGMALLTLQKQVPDAVAMETQSSLLAFSFNKLWYAALRARERNGITHFLMLHSDVSPMGDTWFHQLLGEMVSTKAGVLSVIIPIKTGAGLTSTAMETGEEFRPRRLTLTEAYARPQTWTAPDLLFNTGCLLVDFTQPWVEKVHFTMRDVILQTPEGPIPATEPEDWNFSRQCRALGVSCYVTRKVGIMHRGTIGFSNMEAWGLPSDPAFAPRLVEAVSHVPSKLERRGVVTR